MQLSLTLFVALQTQQGFFLGFGEVGVLISKPVWEDEEVDSMQSMINKVFNNYHNFTFTIKLREIVLWIFSGI